MAVLQRRHASGEDAQRVQTMQEDAKNILIVAPQHDTHAATIAAMIGAAGHRVDLFDSSAWPSGLGGSMLCDTHGARFVRDGSPLRYDTAWCRRLLFKKPAPAGVHEQDVGFIRSEGMLFDLGALAVMGSGVGVQRWINAPMQALMADQKALQLAIAASSGLRIPRTLISHRAEDIRHFRDREPEGVVVKPFNVGAWSENSGYSVSYATRIRIEEPLADGDVSACPTNYQEVVRHRGDVRIVCLQGEYVAVKMTHALEGEIDYRAVRHKTAITYAETALPDGLLAKLERLRQTLAIDFFCADFLVPADGGELVFIELNPGGQFLYLDQRLAQLDIARRFCALLVHGATARYQEFERPMAAVPSTQAPTRASTPSEANSLCE
ncbi:ATP-grasp domain-containing protein [Xanthomonas sacchari]|uniref:ATP-grasp domain-containing protein n=1 Tax=Xanthomonas sacchari TaxID=56458 RepID=UPI0022530C63|nr:hypothetical protein [Xanthomonas sacchari]MCW0387968.1 hypothetical protein [Xanthomonas sacchari]MCW0452336.1 hypothetical protein [Xanthomonas sacchari]